MYITRKGRKAKIVIAYCPYCHGVITLKDSIIMDGVDLVHYDCYDEVYSANERNGDTWENLQKISDVFANELLSLMNT